jgi:hypothetical protein
MLNLPWWWVGQGAKLSVNAGRTRDKVWEWGWCDKPTSQSRGMVGLRAVLKTKSPQLAGGRADQTVAAVGQYSCHLVKTTDQITLDKLSNPNCNLPCGLKEPNTTHKPVIWLDHFRVPAYNQQPIRPRKVGKKNPPAIIPQSCLTREAALPHKAQNTKH